jgi:alpha-glucosidase
LDVGHRKSEVSFVWDGRAFAANGSFGYDTDVVVERVVVFGDGGSKTREGPWGLREAFGFRL